MKGLFADCKHALRLYGRTPGSSLIAVLVLAVGMAFVGAFVSLYVDLALRTDPGFEQSGRIVTIGQTDGTRRDGIPIGLIDHMANELTALDAAAGVQWGNVSMAADGESARVEGVTSNFFVGIRPRLARGRGFDRADHEPDAEPVAVISDRYWRETLGADADVLGTTIDVVNPFAASPPDNESDGDRDGDGDTISFRIVGIMAAEMQGTMNEDVDFWLPSERLVRLRFPEQYLGQVRSQLTLATLGRLSDGASAKSVVSELAARYPESTEEYRLTAGTRFDAVDGVVRDINVQRDAARQLQLFLAASVLLALVAAANVSLFLLARAPGRRRELAIRMSVGAPLKRLARQLASEAGLLVLASAALGLLATLWLVSVIRGLAFLRQAEWSHVTLLDWRVLSLIGVFLLLITTLVSLAPILGLKRLGIAGASRQVAARATLAQRIAGSAQIAMAGSLGGAAIAFAWHLGAITLGDPGYELADRHHVRMYRVVSASDGPTLLSFDNAAVAAARRREVLQSVPAIRDITETSLVPAAQPYVNMIQVNDRLDPSRQISIAIGDIDSAFVDVLGLRLLYGHSPTENENDAALVNQALARRFFGRDDVVGESFDSSVGPPNEIVGVLEDLSFVHPAAEVAPMLLIKTAPFPLSIQGVIESPLTSGELRQQLQSLADTGELEFNEFIVTPLAALRDNLIAPDKARSGLTIATATLVVLVAAFGFYGTLRYLVASGRREYAIRASLGAGPRALGRLVFGRGLVLSLPGLVLGALLAFITVAWLRDDFVSREISAGTVAVGVVAGLVALLLLASVGPARMARRTQPAPLLRED